MTVTTTTNYKEYQADGVATRYAIPFLLLNNQDLLVYLDGQLITQGYSLNGVGNPISEIVFSTPPTGLLLLQRSVSLLRETDYQENGDLLAETINRDFDRIYLIFQGIAQNESQSLRVEDAEGINVLPLKEGRANKVLTFDNDGQPLLTTIQSGSAVELAQKLAINNNENSGAGLIGFGQTLNYPIKTVGNALASALTTISQLNTQLETATQTIAELKQWKDRELFTILYPNDGTEENPAIVEPNKRYLLNNPFPNESVLCIAELYFEGMWGEAGWFWSNGGFGTKSSHVIESDLIVVQTGSLAVGYQASAAIGNPYGLIPIVSIISAPCRVKVWRV